MTTVQFDDRVHLAEERFGPRGAGLYEVSVENGWPDPAVIELRLWLLMHAFHGELRFHGAVIERMEDFTSDAIRTADQT